MRFLKLIEFEGDYFVYDVENVNLYKIEESLFQSIITNEISINDIIPLKENLVSISNERFLTNIHLNVAQVCNLSCGYCYGVDGEYGLKGKMKEGNALKAIDYLIENSGSERTLEVIFFGGEPLLNIPMIKIVVDYCKEKEKINSKKIKFGIVTNGTLFNKEINKYLNDYNFNVVISFDGDKETQDKNRPFRGGKGSYDSILPKIKTFLDSRDGNATARATITNHSKELLHYRNNLKEMGFKSSFVQPVTLSDYSKENYDIDEVSEEQNLKLIEYDKNEIKELLSKVKKRENLDDFKGSKYVLYLKQFLSKTKNTQYCGVSRSMRGIAVNGDIYPCHRFVGDNKFKIGRVDTKNDGAEEEFDIDFVNNHPQCKGCFAKYYCGGGGCIHNNYVKNGNIKELDQEHCIKMHHKIKSLFKFYSDLDINDRLYLVNELNFKFS
ncbi:radical SAM protein [Flavobacterium sp.]|uniref:radical SAM protein n=1 Tax=Flavobacterium sp. TaxID=239 RepID=UPI00374DA446